MMKRTALFLLAFLFFLTGCASGESNPEKISDPTETTKPYDSANSPQMSDTWQEGELTTSASAKDDPQASVPQMQEDGEEEQADIFDMLNSLDYQPYTCDGLPEYRLTAADGTMYAINFSDKWVWRGNTEQAKLSEELISLLKENPDLIADTILEIP